MTSNRRRVRPLVGAKHQPILTWVVDPLSAPVRAHIGTVRDVALAVHGELDIEVVVTGDAPSSPQVAAGIVALLASGGVHPVRVVEDVVRAYADDGWDVSRPDLIGRIAARRDQDHEAVTVLAESEAARSMAAEDRELARAFGDPVDQALYYCGRTDVVRLPGPDAGAREIIAAARRLHRL